MMTRTCTCLASRTRGGPITAMIRETMDQVGTAGTVVVLTQMLIHSKLKLDELKAAIAYYTADVIRMREKQ